MSDVTAQQLKLIIKSLNEKLINSSISRIIEYDTDSIALQTGFSKLKLIIYIKSGFNFIGISQTIKHKGSCSAFCMLLRKYLINSKISKLTILRENDRFLDIKFNNGFSIIAELTGRHSNVFLVDKDLKILGSFKKSYSTTRKLMVGQSYTLPPPKNLNLNTVLDDFNIYNFTNQQIKEIENHKKEIIFAKLNKIYSKKLKKLEKTIVKIEQDIIKLTANLNYVRIGNLFLITINEWGTNQKVLHLDPAPDGEDAIILTMPPKCKTPIDASNFYFSKYKKSKRGIEILKKRKKTIQLEFNKIKEEFNKIKEEDWKQYLYLIEKKTLHSSASKNKKKQQEKNEYRKFTSYDGFTIYVGRNKIENHKLTFQKAKGNDWWFHIRDLPGSHIVMENKAKFLPTESLLDAATLAVLYSDAKKERQGDVIYTNRKYLQSIKGEIGKVTVSKSKNIFIKIDQSRLERLFS